MVRGILIIMNKLTYKDNLRRRQNYKLENKKILKKSILYNLHLKNSVRINISSNLFSETKNHSKVILNNRCIISGRRSKVNKNLKFSRLCFIRYARSCFISGIRKSCW
jgi:ribosomal protein S14